MEIAPRIAMEIGSAISVAIPVAIAAANHGGTTPRDRY